MSEKHFGPYRILEPLGAGGMGEVLLALDTRLDRRIALKLLPEVFTEDEDRLARFRREAKVLASLNHPNIGAIHGLEEDRGRLALVLELVEGETLEERIASGPLPPDECLRVALDVARALEFAHDRGVVHRDVKPANIKITPDGTAKVLDFGLAFVRQDEATELSGSATESPTLTRVGDGQGMVMGTAAYMSPEQARGKRVDRRADLWAFGAVLFEMLTGERLIRGGDVTEVLAQVITLEPDLGRLPADLDPRLRRLIERCLRRDVDRRLPHAGAARLALEEMVEEPAPPPSSEAARPRRGWTGWVAALAVGAALGALGTWIFGPSGTGESPGRSAASEPTRLDLVFDPPVVAHEVPVESPDGRTLAWVGEAPDGLQLFVRRLDELEPRVLPGTEEASAPFFSPDGEWIAFGVGGRLRKVALRGGLPESLAAFAGGIQGGAWTPDGRVWITSGGAVGLQVVPESGGEMEVIPIRGLDASEIRVQRPSLLPGGELFVVTLEAADLDGPRIALVSTTDGEATILTRGSDPIFVEPDFLVYRQRETVVASRLDLEGRRLVGEERALELSAEAMTAWQTEGPLEYQAFVAGTHRVLYPVAPAAGSSLVWVTRDGSEIETGFRGLVALSGVDLAPDRGSVIVNSTSAVEILDLGSESRSRKIMTSGQGALYPRRSPDGRSIAFTTNQSGSFAVYEVELDTGMVSTLSELSQSISTSWAPDGSAILGYRVMTRENRDLWLFRRDGEHELVLQTPFNERAPDFSPDGRAYAYVSDQSGVDEIYVRLWGDPEREWQVSRDGGSAPVWSADGREVYYLDDGAMMMTRVVVDRGVTVGETTKLFSAERYLSDSFGMPVYDVSSDGRWLMVRRPAANAHWRVVLDWGRELEKLFAE